jgi:murein L,D-transpeptidase YcbB/YkuD
MNPYRLSVFTVSFFSMLVLFACRHKENAAATIADSPGEMQIKSTRLIENYLQQLLSPHQKELDSILPLHQPHLINELYIDNAYEPLWCKKQAWLPIGDSLIAFINTAKNYGLFPTEYHQAFIDTVRQQFAKDTLATGFKKEVSLWAKADIFLTDAFITISHHLKLGRLPIDSISLKKDSILPATFYKGLYALVKKNANIKAAFENLEPTHPGYKALKAAIPSFLAGYDAKEYTFVPTKTDSLKFVKALQRRLYEGGYIAYTNKLPDSITLAASIAKFQKQMGIGVDGRAGESTVRALNSSDKEKFYRIAISLDRYKSLPDTMPVKYIWVNAASNWMHVQDGAATVLTSKVICGKPKTRTPVLTSNIKELITYPQWVPPPSIVLKEILPALKRNPGYLARKGFSLETWGGKKMDPYSVNWAKFSKSVPYKIVQGSSDGNALGVMKFVFDNKYSVYLHDTNQRYLFTSNNRSLSHGCVRVQEWDRLARYIVSIDSIATRGSKYTPTDSLTNWLAIKKKKSIPVKTPLTVFIRYITAEGKNGKVIFYEDVYEEDKWIREMYFKDS